MIFNGSGKKQNGSSLPASLMNKTASPSILSQDINILGNIICEGYLDIDGKIDGNIKCTELSLRKNGTIRGDIIADTVHIYGTVKGLLKARSVHLYKTAYVEGIIMHESLSIEDGASVDGQLKRSNKIHTAEEKFHEAGGGNIEILDNVRLIGEKISN
ncbi:MAG: polymer-forming cytoskeletal protein [Alphaproteobacteria bacterium]|nr:polymer-forming cytoskeletal protein [Alphaproteobacteria bacterium]